MLEIGTIPPKAGRLVTLTTLFLNRGVPSLGCPPFPLEVNDSRVLPILGVPDREHPSKLPLRVSPYPSSESATAPPALRMEREVLSHAPAFSRLRRRKFYCNNVPRSADNALGLPAGSSRENKTNSASPRRYRERHARRRRGPAPERRARAGTEREGGGAWALPRSRRWTVPPSRVPA